MVDGQLYRCVSERTHIRKDGSVTTLFEIESNCAKCGELFAFKIPGMGTDYLNRRCAKHRRPGSRVKASGANHAHL